MTTWTPGIAFETVLEDAPYTYVRRLLGDDFCRLLDLLEGGEANEAWVRTVAGDAIDLDHLITDATEREELLRLIPKFKQVELLQRLQQDIDGAPPLAVLNSLRWTADKRAELLEFLGRTMESVPAPGPQSRTTVEPEYGLFAHQRDAIERTKVLLYDGYRRVVLHLPTGVGKTRSAMNIIADHLRQHGPTVVVWLAHGQELLEQAAAEFERAWSRLGDRPVTVAHAWSSALADVSDVSDGVVILGLEKAVAAVKQDPQYLDKLASRSSLVVFDEAHQIIAPTYQHVVYALTVRPECSLLGLTATPGRTWSNIAKDEELSDFFHRQKVMLKIEGYSNPVTALIDDGFLSKPTMHTVGADAGLELSEEDLNRIARSFDIPGDVVQRLTASEQWSLQVVHTIQDLAERHLRILVFAASVEHCRLLAAVLKSMGMDADYVTSESTAAHRSRAITRFKSKSRRTMVLCNYGVLTTGFDAPETSAAVIARPTKSLVLYSQMVGRVIRGPRAGGTPNCEIVTVIDPSLPGFGDLAAAFTNWEDVWETA
ncbi:DEAD/DEAH box helicase [Allonocardiopsis opalescens]|uniref:Superfamily II DNA or RNA helicase n=1 Tax=Allonocardiopsis opalescens TaxID=1144618 RepID=A0A2T0Q280_9ACTN|nr:DEAD/DEAH box helicase [Allonocardiopsis opalescens]PRX97903.1 superfamily II DNA or RNA helicase [Allonocardiopsis opalescens]